MRLDGHNYYFNVLLFLSLTHACSNVLVVHFPTEWHRFHQLYAHIFSFSKQLYCACYVKLYAWALWWTVLLCCIKQTDTFYIEQPHTTRYLISDYIPFCPPFRKGNIYFVFSTTLNNSRLAELCIYSIRADAFECFFDQADQTAAIKMYEKTGWRSEKMRNECMERQDMEGYRKRGRDIIEQFPMDDLNISLQYNTIFEVKKKSLAY